MADSKISALPASTTPLAGTEVLPIVQGTATKQVSVANLTAGRAVSALSLTSTTTLGVTGVSTLTGGAVIQGLTVGMGANAVAGNTAVGVSALNNPSLSGDGNVAVGKNSLLQNGSGGNNTSVGNAALYSNISGSDNTAVGYLALITANPGSNNIGVGSGAGSALTTGSNNTIIGSVAGTAGLSDTVIIAAGSAERMRIDSSGVISYTGSLTVSAYTETPVPITLTSGGAVGALIITAGTVLTATLTSATGCTFSMPSPTAGKSFILLLKQPASGTATTATFTSVKWNSSGAPTITATVGKMDILTFVADGTNWYGSYSQGYTP